MALFSSVFAFHHPSRIFSLLLLLLSTLPHITSAAQFALVATASSSSTISPPQPTSTGTNTPAIFPGTSPWAYLGCYSETTLTNGTGGLRALSGGAQDALDGMTVGTCLDFCQSGNFAFAGLEYSRECYCAPFLSAAFALLQDSSCDLACQGNGSQICGGELSLSVYQVKASTKGGGIKGPEAPMGSLLALGIAMGVSLFLA